MAMENGPFVYGLPIKNGDFQGLCEFTTGYKLLYMYINIYASRKSYIL